MTFTESTALWALVFVLIGASSYVTDKKWGITLYGKVRKWFHPPDATLETVDRGFIYNRSNKARWKIAALVSFIQAIIMIGWRHADPRVELMLFFIITPATFIGFLLGPWLEKFRTLREEGLAKLDKVESGEFNVGKEVREAYDRKAKSAGAFFSHCLDTCMTWLSYIPFLGKRSAAKSAQPSQPAQPTTPSEPEIDPKEDARKARERLEKLKR